MNKLEDIYQANRAALDQLEPKDETWQSIKSHLQNSGHILNEKEIKRDGRFKYAFAASFALLFGLSAILFFSSSSQESTVSKALSQACENETLMVPTGNPATFDPSANSYTLVQFWSSGNALCIEENCFYYLPAYEKFKDKGFEIYAVSLDSDMAEWLAGIEANELPWHHVSDLKGWDSPLCEDCNISKVPMSYLLNQKGELMAKDLDASRLEETLEILFAEI
ncbi:MAG: thioredoxin-like domain-containing protein [Bacteroidota bacterium]